MASDLNKPNGIYNVSISNYQNVIWSLPINALIGVGPKLLNKIKSFNINTIYELVKSGPDICKSIFGINGEWYYNILNGDRYLDNYINYNENKPKSINIEKTYSKYLTSSNEIEIEIAKMIKKLVEKINNSEIVIKTVKLTLKLVNSEIKRSSFQKTLADYTDNYETIYSMIKFLLDECYTNNHNTYLIGVGLSNFKTKNTINKQLSFTTKQ